VAKKLRIDWFMFAITACLALFGVAMVYSASAMVALKESNGETQYTYVFKQFVFAVVGLIGMYVTSKIHYRWYQKTWVVWTIFAITVVMLLATFGFSSVGGARRWVRFAGFSFQPSELAKIAVPIFLAWFFVKREKLVGELKRGVFPAVAVFSVIVILILAEKDLGTVIVLSAVFVTVYFAAGAKWLHVLSVSGALTVIGAFMIWLEPYRMARVLAFLHPEDNTEGVGYQVLQGLYGIGSGGIIGEGFAKGQQKLFYLPVPYSDFIFATIGEELGLIGTLTVLIAFGLLLWRGARAALLAPDRFGMLLGIGIITGLIVQALFNISVVVSILPTKGIPLPFISYGGSSITITLFAVGILLNLSQYSGFSPVRETNDEMPKRKTRSSQGRVRAT
jgi:cell division protein FtsW